VEIQRRQARDCGFLRYVVRSLSHNCTILADLAKEYGEAIYVYKIDVDKEPELASVFGIQSIPTFIFIPQKGDPQMAMGRMPKETFTKVIDDFLLPTSSHNE
jgi:thioredoxin-like negative regulator of GroEL